MMNAIVAILALFVLAGGLYNLYRADELDEREEELDKYSVHLDERANRIATEEGTLRNLSVSFKREVDAFHNRDIYTASYTETDSDVMRYSTNALMAAHAKKHLANTISQDIVKQFDPVEDKTEDGRRRFTYKFKIAEQ